MNTVTLEEISALYEKYVMETYARADLLFVRGQGSYLYDSTGKEYLDFAAGIAVCSLGHCHPAVTKAIQEQAAKLVHVSNLFLNEWQPRLAQKLIAHGFDGTCFFCNSGAEANENAIKLASFATGRDRVVAFSRSFHGRTSEAVAVTDNPKIVAPVNDVQKRTFVPLNDIEAVRKELAQGDVCAVIVEGIQGVGGMGVPTDEFLQVLQRECHAAGTKLILDEVQSGCGRTGKYFAFQHAGISPDIISIAKGIGNGFPVAGILIAPDIEARYGMLGTTFGGNHLACAACLAVIDVMQDEHLMDNAARIGAYAARRFAELPHVVAVKGRGLMLGVEFDRPIAELRKHLVLKKHIFTGSASNPAMIRFLPPLTIGQEQVDELCTAVEALTEKW